MFSQCIVVLICLAVSSGEEYQSYYVPEHHPQIVKEHYDDGASYGHLGVNEHDHGGHRHIENINDLHGARDYDQGEHHRLRDIAQQAHINQGAHSGLHASGGHDNHLRQAHDRGFHEKEKKYAYERGYGYERETKHRDAADNAVRQGSRYQHDENRASYNQKGNALRDLAVLGAKYNRGSEAHRNRNVLVDLIGARNRDRNVDSHYDNRHHLREAQMIPRRNHMRPIIVQRYVPAHEDSLNRLRYMNGINGLGGPRSYGKEYDYSPMRYGPNPEINALYN